MKTDLIILLEAKEKVEQDIKDYKNIILTPLVGNDIQKISIARHNNYILKNDKIYKSMMSVLKNITETIQVIKR